MNAHGHTQSYTLAGVYAHTLIYAHTEGPQCSGHLQYWTQTQAWSLYLHVNGLQQSAALFVCSVPPAVWAWGRELLVRWVGGPHQMGSHGYGAKLSEERGKRLPDWQPLKQQGLPHSMEVVHGLVSFYDWRAAERWKALSPWPFYSHLETPPPTILTLLPRLKALCLEYSSNMALCMNA